MTTTEITNLPEEVIRIIFKKLDGRTLFQAARVCKFWHRIVHELKRNVKMWCEFCLSEIPIPILTEMTGLVDVNKLTTTITKKMDHQRDEPKTSLVNNNNNNNNNITMDYSPSVSKNENVVVPMLSLLENNKKKKNELNLVSPSSRLPWQFWREIYLAYRRTSLISRWPCLRLSLVINSDYRKTTCLKFHGNLLLTGHENGAVLCWINAGTKTQKFTILHRHRSTVTALAVMDNSNLKNGKSSVFTVISGSEDRDLRFTQYDSEPMHSTCYTHSTAITSISSWSNYFVTGNKETILRGQWVFHLNNNLKSDRYYHLLGHSCSYVRCTAMWENKVVSGDEDGNVYIWELIETSKRYLLPLVTHILPGPIQQTLICGDRILCLANKDILAVSLDGKEFYKFSVYNDLFRTPECLGIWGPILTIGLKSGIIAVYHLESDAEWQNLNVSEPLQMLHSGQEHVIDIAITDSGLGLSIAFATDDNSIHLAHWLPRLPQNTT